MIKLGDLLMNYKFQLLNKCYYVTEYYSKLLINYPKSEFVLKQNIEKVQYEMIECLFSYNINTSERIKQKYLKEFLIKVSMLDYYTRISFFKKIISKRQSEVISNRIIEFRKMTSGLIKNDKEDET